MSSSTPCSPFKLPKRTAQDDVASRALGFKTVSLACDEDANNLRSTLASLKDGGFRLVRTACTPCLPPTVLAAPWFTGYAVSNVLTMSRNLDSINVGSSVVPGAEALCDDVCPGESIADLMGLHPNAHSPYAGDPALPSSQVAAVHKSSILTAIADDDSSVVRCHVNGSTEGYLVLRMEGGSPKTMTIDQFVVSPTGWKRGAGSMLLWNAFNKARAAGAHRLEASLTLDHVDAIAALMGHGFLQQGQSTLYHVWFPATDVVRFNVPHVTGREILNLTQAVERNALDSLGPFTRACQSWMEDKLGTPMALLTHSATAALEQAAMLCQLAPGDEVVMPSYTFVSTASAVVLRGATPVFVDVDPATLNVDAGRIRAAITPRTKAIIVVHYAGVPCDMDDIVVLAKEHGLFVIEDAAQAFLSKYKGRYAGTIGHFGCFSFHYTKNTVCGEGGALCVNDAAFLQAAPIVREKGTNRSDFLKKMVAKYEWVGLGSSFEPCELSSAFLLAQLEDAEECAQRRRALCGAYQVLLRPLQQGGYIQFLDVGATDDSGALCGNGHIFWIMFATADQRAAAEKVALSKGVQCFSHYLPLHLSPAGKRYGRPHGTMDATMAAGSRLLRLPMWAGMNWTHVHRAVCAMYAFFNVAEPDCKDTMSCFLSDLASPGVENMGPGATATVTIGSGVKAGKSPPVHTTSPNVRRASTAAMLTRQ